MNFIRVIIVAAILVCSYASQDHIDDLYRWLQYKAEYGKSYRNFVEEWRRFNIFVANMEFVESHNALYNLGETTYSVALNQFADMTNEEFGALRHPQNRQPVEPSSSSLSPSSIESLPVDLLPPSVDWRKKGAVTPVSDEGRCESGWAFSTAGAIEALTKLSTGELLQLSAQQLVDCVTDNSKCMGGSVQPALEYVLKNKGITTEEAYPYTALSDDCKDNASQVAANISGYTNIAKADEVGLTSIVAKMGPVAVEIDSKHISFQFYSQGVYYEKDCKTTELDHGVLVVGYGVLNGTDFYTVKNSWGTTWGDLGYIYMSRNKDNNCGIASAASYPFL